MRDKNRPQFNCNCIVFNYEMFNFENHVMVNEYRPRVHILDNGEEFEDPDVAHLDLWAHGKCEHCNGSGMIDDSHDPYKES